MLNSRQMAPNHKADYEAVGAVAQRLIFLDLSFDALVF
jgi:hypothetical protein